MADGAENAKTKGLNKTMCTMPALDGSIVKVHRMFQRGNVIFQVKLDGATVGQVTQKRYGDMALQVAEEIAASLANGAKAEEALKCKRREH